MSKTSKKPFSSFDHREARLSALFAAIMLLGVGIAAWAANTCPTGRARNNHHGGGACIQTSGYCVNLGDDISPFWLCYYVYDCVNSDKDTLTTPGGCPTTGPYSTGNSHACHEAYAAYTFHTYSTSPCGYSPFTKAVTGTCAPDAGSTLSAKYGYNSGECLPENPPP